jgi:hypothetical protein
MTILWVQRTQRTSILPTAKNESIVKVGGDSKKAGSAKLKGSKVTYSTLASAFKNVIICSVNVSSP